VNSVSAKPDLVGSAPDLEAAKPDLEAGKPLFIGVDPSLSNTGLVVLSHTGEVLTVGNTKEVLKAWHRQSKVIRGSTKAQIYRLSIVQEYIMDSLCGYLVNPGMAHIGYENYSFDSTNRAFSLGELGGVLKTGLLKMPWAGATFTLVPPTSLKQFAVGHGEVGKEAMMAQAALESSSMAGQSDDACDAYFLAKLAWYKNAADQVVEHETYKNLLRSRLEIARGV